MQDAPEEGKGGQADATSLLVPFRPEPDLKESMSLACLGSDVAARTVAQAGLSGNVSQNPGLVTDLCKIIERQSREIASLIAQHPPVPSLNDSTPKGCSESTAGQQLHASMEANEAEGKVQPAPVSASHTIECASATHFT